MRHVLHRTPRTSAVLAAIAVSATCGTALAQAGVTTLNSAKVTLFSMNGTPTSSYWTQVGPTTNTGGLVPMTSFAEPNTGAAELNVGGFFIFDSLVMNWAGPNSNESYVVRFEYDVTFSSTTGGVLVNWIDSFAQGLPVQLPGTTTVTPFGGSAGSITAGDYLANGRYTWTMDINGPAPSGFATSSFGVYEAPAGGAVPLPGAAGLAAIGLVGLSRRRRR